MAGSNTSMLLNSLSVFYQADVIVNLTSDDLNLSNGAVSKLILKKAGQGIQDECKQVCTIIIKMRTDSVSNYWLMGATVAEW